MTKHSDVDVPNLWVIKLMKSMKSKEFVKEQFSWQYYYWYLTDHGIEYLRDFLHLRREVVPATLKKVRTASRFPAGGQFRGRQQREGGDRFGGGGGGGFQSDDKKVGPRGDFQPRFVSDREGGRGYGGDRGGRGFGRGGGGFGDRDRGGYGGGRGGGRFGDRDRGYGGERGGYGGGRGGYSRGD
eukprot:CAMPEP_0174257528 /NCGR_PEP_ID=MMETSP0439-20130205/6633_1 /TAXON_ID=0 /ORGANISM="Stereomyxa ramosa, Strain Chinc5" /LENGTH=183 /DNA_ID=CAMNT_0015340637 /DNA_START=131 /DNA_END=682 /DNA_ORIENTATION=+